FGVTADTFLVDADTTAAGGPGLVLDAGLEDDGVEVGDRYELGGSGLQLPVLGFTEAGTYGHAPIAFVPLEVWQQVQYGQQPDGRSAALALRGDPEAIDRAGAEAGLEVLTKTEAYDGSPGYSAETTTMTLIRGFLLVISALVVGAFFTVLTVQRTRQIGLLKAMGASNGYIVRDSVGQMTVLVAAATAVGVALGVGVISLLDGVPVRAGQAAPPRRVVPRRRAPHDRRVGGGGGRRRLAGRAGQALGRHLPRMGGQPRAPARDAAHRAPEPARRR